MKKMVLLLILTVMALPSVAGAHPHNQHDNRSISVSRNVSFEIDDGEMVITRNSRRTDDLVVVSEDGDLTVNGDQVSTSDRERKLLRKFYRESLELDEMAEAISEDAAKIAAASTKYASAQVAAALRSLSDEESDADDARMEIITADFEAEMEGIEAFGDRIENQADQVIGIADQLQESIPELAELDWFLDD